ncbi:CAP domain-containing protein [Paracrocinitomix mangrovi]|uniref:CAP domain-containing protein n=1 Tax=Paracrocinitomix mangrovi TaxID=2862509 RepID=UPI001C8ECA5C|nr:CAP domain-containing protein [Paracrocinitomix mangrovi]UKN01258.1 CAP domain-containing protein [Paracrocinitomix mangrovi]
MAQKSDEFNLRKLLFISLLFIAQFSRAQEELVELKNFDHDLFQKYMIIEVNKLRERERVGMVERDTSLDRAAQDHVDYMVENNVLSHKQKDKEKLTPFDRIKYYGGSHSSVAENIQMIPLGQKIEKAKGRLTYERLARDMIGNWKKSSGHFTNMINQDYVGITHTFKIKNGMMYCCQLLASGPFEDKYAYKEGDPLHVNDKNECGNCKRFQKKINKDQAHLGWYTVSNDSVYYWNTDVIAGGDKRSRKNNIKRVFSANGAIAVDVIHQEQFNCNGTPNFHNSLYHDGYYIGYVSKASLKNDLHPSPSLVQIYVGQKPAFLDTFYQVDFNLVKRWRPCMHGSTIYMNADFLKPYEYFEIPKREVLDENIIIKDSIFVKIPFKSGQTDQDTSIFYPLVQTLDSLEKSNFKIKQIFFDGVASIEGTAQGNEELFKKRGEIIQAYLRRYYPEFEMQNDFYENFDDFRFGLKRLGVRNAMDMPEDSLRYYANSRKNETAISDLLDETRFSSVRIVYEDVIPLEDGGYGFSIARLSDLIKGEGFRDMIPLYEILAHDVLSGNEEKRDSLVNLEIPNKPGFEKLHWYNFVLRLNLNEENVNIDELNHLKDVGAIPTDADFLEYRLMFNVFNGDELMDVSDFSQIHDEIRVKRQKAWIECLELIMGVQNHRYSDAMVVPILVENTLKKKFDLNKTYFICQYLIDWGYTQEPYVLLSKYARRPGQFPKLYKQYIKLAYFLGQFEIEKEWKRIKRICANLAEANPQEFCDLFRWNQMGIRALDKKEIAELFCDKCREDNP